MRKIFGLFVTILLFVQIISAQKQEKLEKKWLVSDINNLKLIPRLLSPEIQTKETLEKVFGRKSKEYPVEFGAKTWGNGKAGGYTSFTVSVYTYKDSIMSYKISASTSQDSWKLIKSHIVEAWNQYAQIPFQENDKGIFYEYKNDSVFQEYKNSISNEVGYMKDVEVPAELKDEYEYLIAPFNHIQVSSRGCGYSGTTLKSREMIDSFIKAGRVDLIENILKGFNHGGRVYAVIALLEMKKKGIKLTSEVEETIKKVINLDIKVMSCKGCIGYPTTVKELLQEYNLL